jgi:hypothetical protein
MLRVRFEIFTAVTMKNVVFWGVAPCRSCVNRRFGGTYRLYLQGREIRERRTCVSRWLQSVRPMMLDHNKLNLYETLCDKNWWRDHGSPRRYVQQLSSLTGNTEHKNCCIRKSDVLTPRACFHPGEVTVVRQVKKFPAFYGTRSFIIMFIKFLHWTPSWVWWIHLTPAYILFL